MTTVAGRSATRDFCRDLLLSLGIWAPAVYWFEETFHEGSPTGIAIGYVEQRPGRGAKVMTAYLAIIGGKHHIVAYDDGWPIV